LDCHWWGPSVCENSGTILITLRYDSGSLIISKAKTVNDIGTSEETLLGSGQRAGEADDILHRKYELCGNDVLDLNAGVYRL
jgi:hypothetical protein